MRTKLWILGVALSLLAAAPASALKVYRASSEGVADVKVNVTDSKGRADCVIFVASSEGQANGNARWYYEPSAGTADVRMFFTDSAGTADKTVFFTTSEGLAKCDVDWKSYKKETINSAAPAGRVGAQRANLGIFPTWYSEPTRYDKTLEECFQRIAASLRTQLR